MTSQIRKLGLWNKIFVEWIFSGAFPVLLIMHVEYNWWMPLAGVLHSKWIFAGLTFVFLTFAVPLFYGGYRAVWQFATALTMSVLYPLASLFAFSKACQNFGVRDSLLDAAVRDAPTCFYFSTVTFTTLGYGDVVPTPELRPWVIHFALWSYAMTGIVIALFVFLFQRGSPNTTEPVPEIQS